MKPAPFAYARPDSVAEALELLAGEEARALAGGQSLVPMLNFRLSRPELLVDLNGLDELAGIVVDGEGTLHIGAMTRQAALLGSEAVAARWPLLIRAGAHVGHTAIRNRGTVGGSIAHADPAAELPVALTALDARLRLRGGAGERVLSTADFFLGPLTTALEPGELLVEIVVPPPAAGARMAFAEHARTHGDFAVAGVGAVLGDERAAIALLGAAPVPVRASAAEAALSGGAPSAEVARLAAGAAQDGVGDHRRALLAALTARVVAEVRA